MNKKNILIILLLMICTIQFVYIFSDIDIIFEDGATIFEYKSVQKSFYKGKMSGLTEGASKIQYWIDNNCAKCAIEDLESNVKWIEENKINNP